LSRRLTLTNPRDPINPPDHPSHVAQWKRQVGHVVEDKWLCFGRVPRDPTRRSDDVGLSLDIFGSIYKEEASEAKEEEEA
jgi:hypothetical protein